jgi:hypothetical protein
MKTKASNERATTSRFFIFQKLNCPYFAVTIKGRAIVQYCNARQSPAVPYSPSSHDPQDP